MSSTSALNFLQASQNPDGGWGYGPRQASVTEATAAAMLALREEPAAADSLARGLNWLAAAGHPDGGWGLGREDDQSGWQTAWAVLALTHCGGADDLQQQGVTWLLEVKTLSFGDDKLQREMQQKLAIDPTLRGWPWLPGEATWIEPTALALLVLGASPRTPAIQARLDEAVRYIVDRRCRGGGWNFGNPVMLGGNLPPRAHPTAWALLALARLALVAVRPEDIAALRAEMEHDGGASALAWGLLALRGLGEDDPAAADRLIALQEPDGSWNANPYHTAVALMAMRGHL